MEPLYRPEGVEERWQRAWEEEGLYRAGAGARRDESLLHLRPAAERDRRAAHGPRAQRLDPGRARPLAPDARLRHALAAGLRPRRASRRRTWSRSSSLAEGTSRQELGREAFLERTWRWLDETGRTIMGQFRRLGCSLDYERERFTMDDGYVAAVMRFFVHLWDARLDLPREPDRQLVPAPPDRDLRPRGRARRGRRRAHLRPLPVRRRRRARSRSRPSGRRRSSPTSPSPCTRTTSATATRSARGGRAGRRAARARDRRRARRARLRHRRAQDHARPRPGRLRDRPRPRPADADGDRPRRPHDRRALRGADPGGGRGGDPGLAEGARPAREARELPPLGRPVRALPHADRAARLAAVVVRDGRPRAAGDRGARGAAGALPPREPAPLRDRLARARSRLVRLAAALVGPPDPDLDVPRRPPRLHVAEPRRVRRVRLGGARTRPRRARHLVLVRALAVRDARLAGARRPSSSATTRATSA